MSDHAPNKPEPSPSAEIMQGWLSNELIRFPASYSDASHHFDMLQAISRYMAGVEAATKQQALKIAASLHSDELPTSGNPANSDDFDEVIGGLLGIGEMIGGSEFIRIAVTWLQQMANEHAAKAVSAP